MLRGQQPGTGGKAGATGRVHLEKSLGTRVQRPRLTLREIAGWTGPIAPRRPSSKRLTVGTMSTMRTRGQWRSGRVVTSPSRPHGAPTQGCTCSHLSHVACRARVPPWATRCVLGYRVARERIEVNDWPVAADLRGAQPDRRVRPVMTPGFGARARSTSRSMACCTTAPTPPSTATTSTRTASPRSGSPSASLLGIQLMPRLNNFGVQRLYRPDDSAGPDWAELAPASPGRSAGTSSPTTTTRSSSTPRYRKPQDLRHKRRRVAAGPPHLVSHD
jgi:hypothetical protein